MRARRSIRAWLRDHRGLAAVEFAFALPILLLMYLGGFQLSDAIACNRKVTITARAVADLTSQYATLAPSDADTILNASAQIMAPYKASNALVRVSEIYVKDASTATVVWSRAVHGQALKAGAPFKIPPSIVTPDTYLIYSEVNYAYVPPVIYGIVGPLSLSDAIYMTPRISNSVTCNGC